MKTPLHIFFQICTLSLVILLAFSCSDKPVFKKKIKINDTGWEYNDRAFFEVEIKDTTTIYNLNLAIAHAPEFAFQNCYLLISTTLPSGKELKKQLNVDLADKSGRWYGECSGKTCLIKIKLQQSAYFNEIGVHKFSFAQHMRENPLQGIQSLIFSLSDTKSTR